MKSFSLSYFPWVKVWHFLERSVALLYKKGDVLMAEQVWCQKKPEPSMLTIMALEV